MFFRNNPTSVTEKAPKTAEKPEKEAEKPEKRRETVHEVEKHPHRDMHESKK